MPFRHAAMLPPPRAIVGTALPLLLFFIFCHAAALFDAALTRFTPCCPPMPRHATLPPRCLPLSLFFFFCAGGGAMREAARRARRLIRHAYFIAAICRFAYYIDMLRFAITITALFAAGLSPAARRYWRG